MPFSLPSFDVLRAQTLNLATEFSTTLGRYSIVNRTAAISSSSSTSPKQNSLDILIARTNSVISCGTDRTAIVQMFTALTTELRPYASKPDEQNEKASLLLLGALLHRYFRIQKEYNLYTYFMVSKPTDSKLFCALRAALLPGVETYNQGADLKLLDGVTVTTALEVFKSFMTKEKSVGNPNYKNYQHIKDDVNFVSHLDDIINEHKERAKELSPQFVGIRFIESLVKQLHQNHQLIKVELVKWCNQLVRDKIKLDQLEDVVRDELEAELLDLDKDAAQKKIKTAVLDKLERHLKKFIEPDPESNPRPIVHKLLSLLYTEKIMLGLKQFKTPQELTQEMERCFLAKASYITLGGYVLLLRSSQIGAKLQHNIHTLLNNDAKEMSEKTMFYGVKLLKEFLGDNPDVILDCEFFGDQNKLNSCVANNLIELTERAKQQQNAETMFSRVASM